MNGKSGLLNSSAVLPDAVRSGVSTSPTRPSHNIYVSSPDFPNEDISNADMNILQHAPLELSIEFNALLSPMFVGDRAIPPRPQNAWILFLKNYRARIHKEGLNLTIEDVSRTASKEWRDASQEVKTLFDVLARLAKKRHKVEYPNYTYKLKPPNKKRTKVKFIDETENVSMKARCIKKQRRKRPDSSPVSTCATNDVIRTSMLDDDDQAESEQILTSNDHEVNASPLPSPSPPPPPPPPPPPATSGDVSHDQASLSPHCSDTPNLPLVHSNPSFIAATTMSEAQLYFMFTTSPSLYAEYLLRNGPALQQDETEGRGYVDASSSAFAEQ